MTHGKVLRYEGISDFHCFKAGWQETYVRGRAKGELERRKGSRPSPGTIYPALKAMNESGWIEDVKSGSKEKKYKITAKGRKELNAATKKFVAIFCDMREEFEKVSPRK